MLTASGESRGGPWPPQAAQTVMTNDYGQNAHYRYTEIVLAQQKHFISSVQKRHPDWQNCRKPPRCVGLGLQLGPGWGNLQCSPKPPNGWGDVRTPPSLGPWGFVPRWPLSQNFLDPNYWQLELATYSQHFSRTASSWTVWRWLWCACSRRRRCRDRCRRRVWHRAWSACACPSPRWTMS